MLTPLIAAAVVAQPAATIVKPLKIFPTLRVLNVLAGPTGSVFAASLEDNTVRIMDAAKAMTVMQLKGHPQPVYGLAFSPKTPVLATGDESGRIWLWNLKNGQKTKEFNRIKAHSRGIQSLAFSSDGKLLASSGKDDVIIIWDVASGNQVRQLLGKGANIASGVFAPTGSRFYCGSISTGIRNYSSKNWSLTSTHNGHSSFGTVDFAMDPKAVRGMTSGRDNNVVVWDLKSHRRTATLKGHQDWAIRVALTPDARYGASSSIDRTVKVWNLVNGKQIAEIADQSPMGSPLAFTANGKFLVTANLADQLQIHSVNLPPAGVVKGK